MPQIISIHSFRGGTGMSNTAANLAAMLAKQGNRVCVIDTDIQSPGIHILFGLGGEEVKSSLNDFLWHGRAIEEVALDVTPDEVRANSGTIYLVPSSIKPGEITRVLREGYDARQQKKVAEITESQYFKDLQSEGQSLRDIIAGASDEQSGNA